MLPEVDRERGWLTKSDREYLYNDHDYDADQSARNTETRIRKRLRNALVDFRVLRIRNGALDLSPVSDNIADDFESGGPPGGAYQDLVSSVAVMLMLARDAGIDSEEVVADAIADWEGNVMNAEVEIEREKIPLVNIDGVKEQIEHGRVPDVDEIAALVQNQAATETLPESEETYIERLQELVAEKDGEWQAVLTVE